MQKYILVFGKIIRPTIITAVTVTEDDDAG